MDLIDVGEDLMIFLNGRNESLGSLDNWIHTIKGISDDSEIYTD